MILSTVPSAILRRKLGPESEVDLRAYGGAARAEVSARVKAARKRAAARKSSMIAVPAHSEREWLAQNTDAAPAAVQAASTEIKPRSGSEVGVSLENRNDDTGRVVTRTRRRS